MHVEHMLSHRSYAHIELSACQGGFGTMFLRQRLEPDWLRKAPSTAYGVAKRGDPLAIMSLLGQRELLGRKPILDTLSGASWMRIRSFSEHVLRLGF
jgi:hypothetical protein